MADGELQLAIDAKATLGEGPCWDKENKLLYWVDIIEKNVHIHNPQWNTNRVIHVGMHVGTVVPRQSGGLVIAAEQAFYTLDLETEQFTLLGIPPNEPDSNRFNDGKCDSAGRFWAGTMPLTGAEPKGSLYCVDTDLSIRPMLGSIQCSNGMAWSPDHSTMYYIDSPTKQVVAFDYDLRSGNIENQRVVVTIPDGEGVPDGMTIDQEGMLWVAQWDGYKVSRWNPRNGSRMDTISVPAARVTSCTFGGELLDELYITTARTGLDEEALLKQPLAGGVFKMKTNVKGSENYPFLG